MLPTEQQSWFSKELIEIISSPLVLPTIYVTGLQAATGSHSTLDEISNNGGTQTPADYEEPSLPKPKKNLDIDMEKRDTKMEATIHGHSQSSLNYGVPLILGRPHTAAKIHEIVGSTKSSDTTIVVACGPEGLM